MPRWRSSSSSRFLRSLSERNISATQVLPQSNFSPDSRAATARRTACKFAPHVLQNFNSSLWFEPHCGQNISRSCQTFPRRYDAHRGDVQDCGLRNADFWKRASHPSCPELRARKKESTNSTSLVFNRIRIPQSAIRNPLGGGLLLARERDDLLGGVLHPFGDGEVQARLAQDALALLDVRAFEADDDGDLNADILRGLDHPARHHVAADDAAEDASEDGAHVLVREQYAEGGLDALLRSAAANVQEVRRLAPRELDDVHRRHREARAVDHAGDVAVELDVVEVELRRLDLERLLFVEVAQRVEVRVAEQGVVVKVDLRVEPEEPPVLRQKERVDLHEGGVQLLVRRVERLHDLRGLIHQLRGQPQAEGELSRLERAEADRGVNRLLQDKLRRLRRDLLDVHAARGRGHEDGPARRAVEHDAEVELFLNRQPLLDQERAHLAPFGAGLVRDEFHAEHLARDLLSLVGRAREFDAAALAATARVYLRLDDNQFRA